MRFFSVQVMSLTFILSFSALANDRPSTPEWQLVPRSHDKDFQIQCYDGGKLVYGIYNRNNLSEYQVARDIYVRTLPDGRTQLSFLRGHISADKETTYLPGVQVSCEVNEQ